MWWSARHITDISFCVAETWSIYNLDLDLGLEFSWVDLVCPSLQRPAASHLWCPIYRGVDSPLLDGISISRDAVIPGTFPICDYPGSIYPISSLTSASISGLLGDYALASVPTFGRFTSATPFCWEAVEDADSGPCALLTLGDLVAGDLGPIPVASNG